MKTLLIIMSHAGESERLKRHWEFFKRAGVDICGAASENKPEIWPEAIPLIDLGAETGRGGDSLPRNFIKAWKEFLKNPNFAQYDQAAQVEADVIFLKPFAWETETVAAHLAGGPYPNLKANNFYHPPWIVNRKFMPTIIDEGEKMLVEGDIESGYTDFFLGRLADRKGFKVEVINGVYSRNTIDNLDEQVLVRQLVQEGRLSMIHGIKSPEQLKAIVP